jgi:hypothetical protein
LRSSLTLASLLDLEEALLFNFRALTLIQVTVCLFPDPPLLLVLGLFDSCIVSELELVLLFTALGGFAMADEESSDFTFCKIDFEGDGGLEFPKAIPVASTPGDAGADNLKTKKIEGNMQANNSIKDQTSNSISSSINRVSLEDSNGKESVLSRENTQSNLSSQPKSSKKPAARAKVPFEKGYSQMDWLKLTRTHPDLAGKL